MANAGAKFYIKYHRFGKYGGGGGVVGCFFFGGWYGFFQIGFYTQLIQCIDENHRAGT